MTSAVVASTSATISIRAATARNRRASLLIKACYRARSYLRPDLAHSSWHTNQRDGHRALWLDYVSCVLISAMSYAALFVMLKPQLYGSLGRIGLGLLLMMRSLGLLE